MIESLESRLGQFKRNTHFHLKTTIQWQLYLQMKGSILLFLWCHFR